MDEENSHIESLNKMRKPFADNLISKLPKPTKQQTEDVKSNRNLGIRCQICKQWHHKDVVHLDYVGHAAITDRLLEVDPTWYWEPLAYDSQGLPLFDKTGGLWIKLTVCGHTRLGYGNAEPSQFKDAGAREKEVIGDALRNAAMRFGAALELWHKGDLHTDQNDQKDTEKTNTVKPSQTQKTQEPVRSQEPKETQPQAFKTKEPSEPVNHSPTKANGISDAQRKRMFAMSKSLGWDEPKTKAFIREHAQVESSKDLTRDAYEYITTMMQDMINRGSTKQATSAGNFN